MPNTGPSSPRRSHFAEVDTKALAAGEEAADRRGSGSRARPPQELTCHAPFSEVGGRPGRGPRRTPREGQQRRGAWEGRQRQDGLAGQVGGSMWKGLEAPAGLERKRHTAEKDVLKGEPGLAVENAGGRGSGRGHGK